MNTEPKPDLRSLLHKHFPGLTDQELNRAEEKLIAYMHIVVRIYESALNDPARRPLLEALTSSHEHPTIGNASDNANQNP